MKFEWDLQKAALNLLNGDPLAATIPDPEHSTEERRFITMGVTPAQRLLAVVHTDRGDRIRLISARPASRAEKKKYEEGQEAGR